MPEIQVRLLYHLARLYGVEPVYYDGMGRYQQAPVDSLLAILRVLGAPVETLEDVPGALREFRQRQWQRCCEPIVVAWDGEPAHLELSLPADREGGLADCRLELENGEERCWTCNLDRLPVLRVAVVEGVAYVVKQLTLPSGLPWGYHRFTLALPARFWQVLIIAAPRQAYIFSSGTPDRIWGVFLPLYALHSRRSWGAGDLTDLGTLVSWVQKLGGNMVGTLPLLAAFLDEPFDPSPYAPASRLFWNEFYLDVTRIPELKRCPEAQDLLNSPKFQKEIADLKAAPLVDYCRGMALKRKILECLARCCFAGDSGRLDALRRWVAEHPRVQDYARFRATVEQQRAGWPAWPQRMRDGVLRQEDYNPEVERYHLYVQWVTHEQFQTLSVQSRQQGAGLYLDLPLGVHSAGYDVWRERDAFALKVSSGAPPDAFFTRGQDWGFPPLHPERIREQGYRYYIACLRHHLQHAGILRLDHVMGLHRLFWIPAGLEVSKGAYVRYRSEEFYAILALESHRYKTVLVGEDLGNVPAFVRTAMSRHKVFKMYILPFQLTDKSSEGLRPVPTDTLASLNTHDMPPFSAFWLEKDSDERKALISFLKRKGWLEVPTVNIEAVLKACLKFLSASGARILLVNLEDLWLEMAPQNVPGTKDESPNWRRKARYTFEAFSRMPGVFATLQDINRLRKIDATCLTI